jgi:hypothetical protein
VNAPFSDVPHPLLVLQLAVRRLRHLPRAPDPIDPRVRPLLVAAMIVPVVFFGLANLAAQGEANWPAVYVLGATPLLRREAPHRWLGRQT